jgi:site-specific DNA-cytosine methylase
MIIEMGKMTNHDPKPPSRGSLMGRVAKVLADREMDHGVAAKAIGVGLQTLQNHLAGEHVRSDSARKYEDWLTGSVKNRNIFVLPARATVENGHEEGDELLAALAPERPRLVVDIFSGCGGLSLGFDLLDNGRQFRTILAIDNQAAPIAVLNRNARLLGGDQPVGRRVDLTEFANEAEFLTFYVQHVAIASNDETLLANLGLLASRSFPTFLSEVAAADRRFLEELEDIRASTAWSAAYKRLDRQALSQTSVLGFYEKLRLPRPSTKTTVLPPLLWEPTDAIAQTTHVGKPSPEFVEQAGCEWDEEVAVLRAKRQATGRGQLTASARRVGGFVAFLTSKAMAEVRLSWIQWRARRLTLRTRLFGVGDFASALQRLYKTQCQVSVLVGGPPCQGFSRIGRGKIRSLRDARVHVHGDARAGDARNLLFQQYVMVLEALRPTVFLFENVQHFQSTVVADGVHFQATEVLAEAIANMSDGEAIYKVSSRVIDASRYGVPQTRQRYFMAGVLVSDGDDNASAREAESCLLLKRLPEVPLSIALAGLPDPEMVGGTITGGEAMTTIAAVTGPSFDTHLFTQWIRQPKPGTTVSPHTVDGHAARAARIDDAAFFALMGPGKRWMDYRADEAQTVDELGATLDALLALPVSALEAAARAAQKSGQKLPNRHALSALRSRINGSLPLRLLLEQTSKKIGAPHHLLAEGYLAKEEGNHGDWVARMDSSRPAKTIVSHMGKDTYPYVHPAAPRTISVREAARIQSFPDWFVLEGTALTDAFKMIGNAVPPMLSCSIAGRVAHLLSKREALELGPSQMRTAT